MTLGANQIAAYAADLLDVEDQIEALQEGKRETYKALREEHGKADANALKRAVKLFRMDGEKRGEAEAVDTEAHRMLAIIEKGRAPRATRAREIIEEFPPQDLSQGVAAEAEPGRPPVSADQIGSGERAVTGVGPESTAQAGRVLPEDAPDAASTVTTASSQALKLRPYCLHSDDLSKCAGQGRQHCHACLKAHADDVGEAA